MDELDSDIVSGHTEDVGHDDQCASVGVALMLT